MHVVGLDFETFFSNTLPLGIDADGKTIRGYTLKKMSTEQYVRHELFELVMVTVVDYHTKAVHKIVTDRCDVMQAELLKLYPDWSQVIVIAHNSVFDGSILEWRVGLRAKAYICTMQMANVLVGMKSAVSLAKLSELFGLPPKGDDVVRMDGKRLRDISKSELDAYVAYCERDTLNALMLFDRYMAMGFPVDDLQIVDSTIKMFVRPQFIVDVPLAQRSLVEEKARRAKLLTDIGQSAEAIRSNDQFADLLRAEGVEPPMKPSPSDPEKLIYAFAKTDEELIELQEHENPRVAALVDVRLGVKSSIIETRLEKFLDIASRGALPVAITYGGAKVTHRFSANRSEASNMQNLPRGSVLREVVAAPPGHVMVATDLSAIELRVARWLAWRWYQDAAAKETLDLVRSGGDVYCATASRAYGRTITKADKTERQAGKETELSCQFGVGHVKLNHRLRMAWGVYLEPGMDKVLVSTFREVNKYGVIQGWKDLDLVLAYMADGNLDGVRSVQDKFYPFVISDDFRFVGPNGLAVYYPELRWEANDKGKKALVYSEQKGSTTVKKWVWGGVASNNLVQHLAGVILKHGWNLMLKERVPPAIQVHDELISCPPEQYAAQVQEIQERCMTTVPAWAEGLPLAVETHIGKDYKACK